MNCNHPVVRDLIRDSLRYWVTEMHIDGFRFDLASILGRGTTGTYSRIPRCLNASRPTRAGECKAYAEAWDAAGCISGELPKLGTVGRVECTLSG